MMRNQELFRDEFFGKDNLALLDTVALEQITGRALLFQALVVTVFPYA